VEDVDDEALLGASTLAKIREAEEDELDEDADFEVDEDEDDSDTDFADDEENE